MGRPLGGLGRCGRRRTRSPDTGSAMRISNFQISAEIAEGQPESLVPKPPKHEAPLTIEFPNLEKTSAEWLKVHSLKGEPQTGPRSLTGKA